MLINGDGELLLCLVLADDVFVEEGFDLAGLGKRRPRRYRLSLLIVGDDLVADVYALIADVNRRAGNELFDFILRFAAEGTAQGVVSSSYHGRRTPFETVRFLLSGQLESSFVASRTTLLTRGARSLRLLNHSLWPEQQTNNGHVRRRVQPAPCSDPCAWQGFATSVRECG